MTKQDLAISFWKALFKMCFKKYGLLAYPVDNIINIYPVDMQLGTYRWRTIPFFVLGLETILGISYSGFRRFNPMNYEYRWYQLHIAKFFQDRILTCGSIEPISLPRTCDIMHLLVAFSSSMSLLCSPRCRLLDVNTTFIPSMQGLRNSILIGIILGRVSKRIEDVDLLSLANEIKATYVRASCSIAYLREMRYVACTSMNSNVVCTLRKMHVLVPMEIDKDLNEGATGLFIVVKRRGKDAYPIISRIIEIVEASDFDSLIYIPMTLLSSALMLASTFTPSFSSVFDVIPHDYVVSTFNRIFEYVYTRIIHPAIPTKGSCNSLSLLSKSLDELRRLNIVLISNKENKNIYWLKGPQVQQFMRLIIDTKIIEHQLEKYIKCKNSRVYTARDLIRSYVNKGYFTVI